MPRTAELDEASWDVHNTTDNDPPPVPGLLSLSSMIETILPRFAREVFLHPPLQTSLGSVLGMRKLLTKELVRYHQPVVKGDFALLQTTSSWLSSGQQFGERLVLTSSVSGQIQATTIQQYLDQTWTCDSALVVSFFKD